MIIDLSKYMFAVEAIRYSRRQRSTFYDHVKRGNISFIEIGGRKAFLVEDIKKIAKKR